MEDKSKEVSLKQLLENKEYLKMTLADVVSRFGDSLDAIAFGWMVYGLTGSKSWLAIIFGVNTLPAIIFQPFAGALVEFFDKKKIVVLCDMGRGFAVLTTGILLLNGILQPWHLLILTFINSSFEALRIPCGAAIVPLVLDKKNYAVGLSYNQSIRRIFELIGFGMAGFLISVFGAGGAIVIDAVTFVLSGAILSFLKLKDDRTVKQKISLENYREDFKAGFLYFKDSRIVFTLCVVCIVLNITALPIDNLQSAFVSEGLRLGVMAMSVGGTAMSIGLILGAFLCPDILRFLSNKIVMLGSGVVMGCVYFALSAICYIPHGGLRYVSFGIASFTFGFISSLIGITMHIIFMSNIPNDYVGRVSSIFNAITAVSLPAGFFVIAVTAPFFSIIQIYMFTGLLTVIVFLIIMKSKSADELK